jgi:hypothetical protein
MKFYRLVWVSFCLLTGVTGAVGALDLSLASAAALFAVVAVTGGVAAMVASNPDDPLRLPGDRWRSVRSWSVLAGSVSVAAVGLGSLLGGWAAALLLALAVGTSPGIARRWIGWFQGPSDPEQPLPQTAEPCVGESSAAAVVTSYAAGGPAVIELGPADPGLLTDEALCLAWRRSFGALERSGTAAQRMEVVEHRSALLGELERRSPDGVAAWLASGARAAGNPARFVIGDGAAGRTCIDWDSLIQGTER